MTSLTALTYKVKSFLNVNFMYAEEEWLSGCVEYLSQDAENNYSESEIRNLAKEQWLLNDLKDICPGSLPVNLSKQNKTILNGKFVLQINAATDIGTPAYQQYLKLQKVNTENIEATSKFEDKVANHRMIKLYLTDGIQNVTGIEYKPMRNLSCTITPGCKVLIKGPVVCRRGMLLLQESSVELLGGEVQELTVSNTSAGLLSSKLGLPLTLVSNENTLPAQTPRNTSIPAPHTEMPVFNLPEELQLTHQNVKPVARVTSLQAANNYISDEDIDLDQIAEIEAEFTNKRTRDDIKTPNPTKKVKYDTEIVCNDEFEDDFEPFFNEDEDLLREMETKFDNELDTNNKSAPVKKEPDPIITIKKLNEMSDSCKLGKIFKVKARILKLLSKLTLGKEGWSLKCTLIDDTSSIAVEFTSDVLSKIVGFTPDEMKVMKKEKSSKPDIKLKGMEALQKARESLQILHCIIELKILEVPQIIALHDFQDTNVKKDNI